MAREILFDLGKMITDRLPYKFGIKRLTEEDPEYILLDRSLECDEQAEIMLKMGLRKPKTLDVIAKIISDAQRLPAGENGCAGIAGFIGTVPEPVVAGQIELRLLRAHFRFLQADHIGVGKGAKIQKAFIQAGPQAVDVPGYQFHGGPPHFVFHIVSMF